MEEQEVTEPQQSSPLCADQGAQDSQAHISILHSGAERRVAHADSQASQVFPQVQRIAVEILGFAQALPDEPETKDLRRQAEELAHAVLAPSLLGICNEITPTGVTQQTVTLLPSASGVTQACAENGVFPLAELPVLRGLAERNAAGPQAFETALLQLIPRQPDRGALIFFLQSAAGSTQESVARLLRRAHALIWFLPSAAASDGQAEPPVDLWLADPEWLFTSAETAPQAIPVLRDVQQNAPLLFQDSRLMGLRVAQQRLSASPAASLHRLNHALGQTAETVSAWNVGLTSLSATLREDLEQGRGIGRRLREARHLCAAILPDWEARRLQGCSWLEEPAPSLAALPEALRQGCEVLRNDYQQMLRERRFLDREVVRAAEERGFLERRFGEIRLQPPAEEELALQLLGGLLGEEIPPAQLAEEARIREQLDHCLAEEVGMSHRLEDLELENVRLKNETARLVEQIVSQLRQLCTISSDVAELRRASLRRFRWAVQARAGVFNAVSQLAGSTLTLQNAISELRALPGLDALSAADACLTSLADCRSLCEALWQLHEAAGNSRWLRIYRRILQMELQNVAETVHDCSGVLIALQAGLKRVPASELLAGLTEYAAGNDSTLAHFALALCEWLSHPDCEKARAVCAILARLDPEGSSVTALMDFVDEHASECSTAFLDAIQQALPQSSRTVLLRAPRSSQAYEQALLRMGNELLKAFHNSPDRVE